MGNKKAGKRDVSGHELMPVCCAVTILCIRDNNVYDELNRSELLNEITAF